MAKKTVTPAPISLPAPSERTKTVRLYLTESHHAAAWAAMGVGGFASLGDLCYTALLEKLERDKAKL